MGSIIWWILSIVAIAVIVIIAMWLMPELTVSSVTVLVLLAIGLAAFAYIMWLNKQDRPLWRPSNRQKATLVQR
jgi:membrane protein implicated in regulation of membrane protease activity